MATLSGTLSQKPQAAGAIVEIMLQLGGGARGQMRVRLGGRPIAGEGLSMTGSQVDLTGAGMSSPLQGRIVALKGDRFLARVADSSGTVLDLQADLRIDNNNTVTGTLSRLR
jgi:hypothetical protein